MSKKATCGAGGTTGVVVFLRGFSFWLFRQILPLARRDRREALNLIIIDKYGLILLVEQSLLCFGDYKNKDWLAVTLLLLQPSM